MKASLKFLVLLVAMFPLAFVVSCSDDEEDVDREPLIVGEWTLESQKVVNPTAISDSGIPIPAALLGPFVDTLKILPESSKMTFDQDYTYTISAPQQTSDFSGTWSLSDDQSTITLSGLEGAEALLGSSSLAFIIQNINATNFSMLTSVPEIVFPNIPTLGTVRASGDYQLVLEK